jgi:hypothetical protein
LQSIHNPSEPKLSHAGSGRTQIPEAAQKLYPTRQIWQSIIDELKTAQFNALPLLPMQEPPCKIEPKAQEMQFPRRSTLTQ